MGRLSTIPTAEAQQAAKVISPNLQRKAREAWVPALLFLLVGTPLLFGLRHEISEKHNPAALLGLVFPLVGLGFLLQAIRILLIGHRFGASRLELDTIPGVIGGHLRGTLSLRGKLLGMERIDLALQCHRHTVSRSGGEDRSDTHLLWSDADALDALCVTFAQTELRLPVSFRIPYSCEPTQTDDAHNRVIWTLRAQARVPGVDLDLAFEVPVQRTPESDPSLGERPETLTARQRVVDSSESPDPKRIRVDVLDAQTRRYTITCWPGMRFFSVWLVVALGCAGATAFLTMAGPGGLMAWVTNAMAVVFGLVSLALMAVPPSLVGKFIVTAGQGNLAVRRTWGPFRRERCIDAGNIESIAYKRSASGGDRQWFRVYAQLAGRRKLTIAGMVYGPLSTQWLVRELEERLTRE